MRLEMQEYRPHGVETDPAYLANIVLSRATIVPSAEEGVFVIDGDEEAGELYANRAVGRIGIYGLVDDEVTQLKDREMSPTELFECDRETGSIFLKDNQRKRGIVAHVCPDDGDSGWKSIRSFREFGEMVLLTDEAPEEDDKE